MSEQNDKKLQELLRTAIPPVGDVELRRELWPEMVRRLEERALRVPWFDWALATVPAVWLGFFPELIPVFLYLL